MRKTFVITFLAACLIAAYTLSASAQTINACYQKNDGQLRRVNAPADCRTSEIPVSWNMRGAAGPKGDKGDKGNPGESGSKIRRIDCGSGGCPDGCATDEIAISAFCGANALPVLMGERDVQCSSNGAIARPAVLICAKR